MKGKKDWDIGEVVSICGLISGLLIVYGGLNVILCELVHEEAFFLVGMGTGTIVGIITTIMLRNQRQVEMKHRAEEAEIVGEKLADRVEEIQRLNGIINGHQICDALVRQAIAHMVLHVQELESENPRGLGYMGSMGEELFRRNVKATEAGFDGPAYISTYISNQNLAEWFVEVVGSLTSRITRLSEAHDRKRTKVRILTGIMHDLTTAILKVAGDAHAAPASPVLADIRKQTTSTLLEVVDDVILCDVLDEEERRALLDNLSSPPFHTLAARRVEWILSDERPSGWGRTVYLAVCAQNGHALPD